MSDSQVSLLRAQFQGAHSWFEGTVADVTDLMAHWQPAGQAQPIAAHYVHVLTAEDYFFNAMLTGGTPIMAAGDAGFSEPPPMGSWAEWSSRVRVDMSALRGYAQKVYAATDAYLASLSDEDLTRELDLTAVGLGHMSLGMFVSTVLINCSNHCGEIACLKGLQGVKGYPM
jgi:uncharacterized damage-inducible protein DinB